MNMTATEEILRPPLALRWGHLQTLLASQAPLRGIKHPMQQQARKIVLTTIAGGRLLGFHSPQSTRAPRKGLFVLLHGWEGSADSAYILSLGHFFFQRGYDIFRLNLRDHGPSHDLNPDLFHGARIEETHQAVHQAALLAAQHPVYLVGFSLGGNFALRIAKRQRTFPIPGLEQVFAVSAPLDPYQATMAIDAGWPLYRWYFLRKWKRSLRKKQELFPERFDFTDVLKMKSCLAMTAALMPHFPEFRSLHDYFNHYTLNRQTLKDITVPTTMVTARDDPFLAVDLSLLPATAAALTVSLQPYGGHCGFRESIWGGSWLARWIEKRLHSQNHL